MKKDKIVYLFKFGYVLLIVIGMHSCRCSDSKPGGLPPDEGTVMSLEDSLEAVRKTDSADRAERRLEQMERWRQAEILDSLAYLTEPLIGTSEAAELALALKRWTDFHKINISDFRLGGESTFDAAGFLMPDDPQSVYYEEFDVKYHGVYTPQNRDYSPDRRRYINVLEASYVYREEADGKWYYMGSDDAQKIDFVDLDRRIVKMVIYTGTAFMDGAFWVDNDRFALTQTLRYENCYWVYYYDLVAGVKRNYRLKSPVPEDRGTYMEYDMRERGVTIL